MGRISLTIWGERGIRARSVYPPPPIKRDSNSDKKRIEPNLISLYFSGLYSPNIHKQVCMCCLPCGEHQKAMIEIYTGKCVLAGRNLFHVTYMYHMNLACLTTLCNSYYVIVFLDLTSVKSKRAHACPQTIGASFLPKRWDLTPKSS